MNCKLVSVFLPLAPLLFGACSLISIEQADEPLPPKAVNARRAAHEYAGRFALAVQSAADSIIAWSPDQLMKLNAIRWKLHAITEARAAAFRQPPIAALVDSWVFAEQMEDFFSTGMGSGLFGGLDSLALWTSIGLRKDLEHEITNFTSPAEFESYRRFVRGYAEAFRLRDLRFSRPSSTDSLWAFLGVPDSAIITSVGSLPQVVQDHGSQARIVLDQIPAQSGWALQIFARENGLATDKLDSLARFADRLAVIAEKTPERLSQPLAELNATLDDLFAEIDRQRKAITTTVTHERTAITESVHEERAAIMADLKEITVQAVNDFMSQTRQLVNALMFWLVVILIIVLGVPFALGVVVGRTIGKRDRT